MSSQDHEDTFAPHENTTSPQDPSRERSATGWGFFWILGEIVLLLIAAFVAVRIFIADSRPDVMAWILVVIAVALAVDIVRRAVRAKHINRQAAQDVE
jgi:hypothetical protein